VVFILMVAPEVGAQFVAPGAVLPVVANLPGINNTDWRTDVNVVNLGTVETSIVMQLLPEIRNGQQQFDPIVSEPMIIAAGNQRTMRNIVESVFGLTDEKGALNIFSTDGAPLVVGARIYTLGDDGGSYGQNVEGVLVANTAWASGVTHDDFYRTNVGIYLPIDPLPGSSTRYDVKVFDTTGTEVGSGVVTFEKAGVQQFNLTTFGVGVLLDGYLEVSCADTTIAWYAYISRVDQVSGDAVFRPVRGRQSDLP
jgi:hypothetical protein